MINIYSGSTIQNDQSMNICKVKSIIITTDKGDIILAPCKDAVVSLTTTETFGALNCLSKKEVTIETQYTNMVIIK